MVTSRDYAKTFCSVLAEFSSEGWESCNKYVDMTVATPPEKLEKVSTDWTLLLLAGFGGQCLYPDVTVFLDAAEHLKDKHQIPWHHIPVEGFGSSERNAELIREEVAKLPSSEQFIIVAHSKGAADAMVALKLYPAQLSRVKALITIAGAVGGSWLVDDLMDLNESILRRMKLPCAPAARIAADNGIDSMQRKNRQEFLAATEPMWRAYSISAVSTKDNTSKVLMPLWRRLEPYGKEQDSHIMEREAIVPGGAFLGRALGDHWAVANPFDGNPKVKKDVLKIVNHNRYPRPALIEAAVRLVTEDLKAHP
jgi:pimeloyl-ACP methyl ester carboxylesterase